MSRFLKNIQDLDAFRKAVLSCHGDVWLRKNDGTEEFNLKSQLSQYIALGRLCEDHGSDYEVFCQFATDEANLLKFFHEHDVR